MSLSITPRATKLTNQLRPGEYIMQPGENSLLRVLDVVHRKYTTIKRLEGHYAGTSFTAGQKLGRHWEVIPSEEAQGRLEALALVAITA